MQNLVNGLNILIRRSVQDNDNGANETNGTSKLAQDTKLFIQEI